MHVDNVKQKFERIRKRHMLKLMDKNKLDGLAKEQNNDKNDMSILHKSYKNVSTPINSILTNESLISHFPFQ